MLKWKRSRADMSIAEIIESTKEDICDNYCKYTEQYLSMYKDPDEAQKRMIADKCNYCPLGRL